MKKLSTEHRLIRCNIQGTDGKRCPNTKPLGYKRCYICSLKYVQGTDIIRFYPNKYNEDLIIDITL